MAQKITKESITTNYKNSGVNLRFDDELDLKLKQYIYLNDNKPNRQNYIIDLIEKDLKGLVLDNTFIELDKPLYFNKRTLKETGVVKTTNVLYDNDLEETIIIEKTPNNLDVYNHECRSYCYGDTSSIHAGVYIIPNLDGSDDYYLNFLYDSDKKTITIRLFQDIDTYFNNNDKNQLKIKEKLLSRVKEIKTNYKNGKFNNSNDVQDFCIMYNYLSRKKLKEKLEKKIPVTINSKFKDDEKKNLFEYSLKVILFKDF